MCIGLVLGLVLGQGVFTTAQATDINEKSPKELALEAEAQLRPQPSNPGAVPPEQDNEGSVSLSPFVVLYDQTANINANATSQNFEASFDAYDNQAADDFVVPAGGGWNVTTVFAPGVYSNTTAATPNVRVVFYADAGGIPGATICDFPALPIVDSPRGSYLINIPGGCILSPGTKWVSVIANLNFTGGGQWFWSTRTVLTGNPSKWRNPGGGFATPCSDWGTRTTCLSGQTDPDMAFRLEGTIASCTVDADCADGNLCNGVETCSGGSCVPGTPVNCDDGDFCTIDSCNPATGACSYAPNPCDDGDSCTVDSCVPGTGCVHVSPPTVQFCNTGPITIPSSGAGAPYPSNIAVSGLSTSASICSVQMNNMNHTWPDDLDVLVVGPTGGNVLLMSDAGGSFDLIGVNLTFKDGSPLLPDSAQIVSGTYGPTNFDTTTDVFPAPAPASPFGSQLGVFSNTNPNGTWSLYVRDDTGGDSGTIGGGWCLNVIVLGCDDDADCSDGNFCNGLETCVDNSCQPGTPINCDDGLFCTIDSCVPATGACEYAPNPCEDGDLCTTDSCVEGVGCQHAANCVSFCNTAGVIINDGSAPTPGTPYPSSISVSGVGVPAIVAQVRLLGLNHTFPDDIDVLLVSPYDPNVNATIMSDCGGSADLVNVDLTLTDTAATLLSDAGPIVSGTYRPNNVDTTTDNFPAPAPPRTNLAPLSIFGGDLNGTWDLYLIDDANIDSGTMAQWCLDLRALAECSVDADCDDGDACTVNTCENGTCVYTPITCDDGNACTADSCDPASGCVYTPITCDDGNACTTDSCDPATGCEYTPITCDDGDACTTDSCDPATGCVYTPVVCADDGNVCTDDVCDPIAGCVYIDNTAPCDDGNACTTTDACSAGVCVGRDPVVCTAAGPCYEVGVCDPATGVCSNPVSPNGTPCDDGNTCTTGDACVDGACIGDPTAITDPNPRTNGYYKRLCIGPHSGDFLSDADAACTATVAPLTFGWVSTAADVCSVIWPSTPNNDKCQQSEDDLMVLALNVCKARVCPTQGIDSQCSSNSTVGQSLAAADMIFSDPNRNFQTCQYGKCIMEEINTGRALVMNSLRIAKAAGGGVTLTWTEPYVDDGQTVGAYKIWRRVHGNGAFVKIATVNTLTFTDTTVGVFDYEVTATRQN